MKNVNFYKITDGSWSSRSNEVLKNDSLLESITDKLEAIFVEKTGELQMDIEVLISFDIYYAEGKYVGICNYRTGAIHNQSEHYQGVLVLTDDELADL